MEPLLETTRFARENEACTNVEVTADVDGQHESFHAHRGDAESFLTSDLCATSHAFSNTVTGEWSRSPLHIQKGVHEHRHTCPLFEGVKPREHVF